MSVALWAIGSAIAVSLIALIAAIPLLIKKNLPKHVLMVLLSISVGTLLATVVLHFLPEIYGHGHEAEISVSLTILVGFLVFFLLEKLIHYHHSHDEEQKMGHGHAYHLAPINLIGDAVHNFIDGLVIAAAYVVSIPVGIAATISVLFHELPQEIADMGVLLYAGLNKTKAVLFNLVTALTAVLGALIGILLATTEHFVELVIPFAAGMFIYIAASNLVPELHRDCGLKDTFIHVVSIIAGIGIMVALYFLLPHAH